MEMALELPWAVPEISLIIDPQPNWFWSALYDEVKVDWPSIDPWGKQPAEVVLRFNLHGPELSSSIQLVRGAIDFLTRYEASFRVESRMPDDLRRTISPRELEDLIHGLRPQYRAPPLIELGSRLEGEEGPLVRSLAAMHDKVPRVAYARWLAERGATNRGHYLLALDAAVESGVASDVPSTLSNEEEWCDLMGGRLLSSILSSPLAPHRRLILSLARPALAMRSSSPFVDERELDRAGSKIWGRPDLPPNVPWPLHRDCTTHFEGGDEKPDAPCEFLGQVNLNGLRRSAVRGQLPEAGLLSIFAIGEVEDSEIVAASVLHFPDVSQVRPAFPPGAGKELARVRKARALQFREGLRLPEYRGPYGQALRDASIDERVYNDVCRAEFGGGVNELLGYGLATTGEDPTKSRDWRHLAWLKTPGGIGLHLQIRECELRAARFETTELAWVDFD